MPAFNHPATRAARKSNSQSAHSAETCRALLELALDAHFNLLRCWGGAQVSMENFFEQCDALGLLVWQEFPFACNYYSDSGELVLVLSVAGHPDWSSRYCLSLRPAPRPITVATRAMNS